MESNFSATLRLTDLNDFIAPSQECIKPPEKSNEVGIHDKKKVEISLGDCLACSGCITSAESILIEQQSHEQIYRVLNKIKEGHEVNKLIVTLSHQAIASFATKFEVPFQDAAEKICSFFHQLGFAYVFDLTLARHLALIETIKEFNTHYEQHVSKVTSGTNKKTPLLCSVCPGFVCYVEKTHSQLVPLLSKVKSPQQIQGHLIRQVWSKRNQIESNQIYHVTLMPCFDKKLEASRKEFIQDTLKDVDCVITPIELQLMMEREKIAFDQLTNTKLDSLLVEQNDINQSNANICTHIGSGSGGYAEHVYRFALNAILNQKVDFGCELNYEIKRNKDFIEISFTGQSDQKINVAIVNGFRNIQTIVQRHKRKMLNYDYIEVMACPTGCLNGGGLLRDVTFDAIQQSYRSCESIKVNFDDLITNHMQMCTNLFSNDNNAIEKALRTTFNVIPKMENILNIAW